MSEDDKQDQGMQERCSPFVVHEEPGECRHGMVPDWCAICRPRAENEADRGARR
jgi:hypothetical protein